MSNNFQPESQSNQYNCQGAPTSNNPFFHLGQALPSYASWGVESSPNLGNGCIGIEGGLDATAAGQRAPSAISNSNQYSGRNNASFCDSYPKFGEHNSIGNQRMYSVGNHVSMPNTQMNGSSNEFLYITQVSSYGSTDRDSQQRNAWSHPQQHNHYQQQLQSRQDYTGHPDNHNSLSDPYRRYRPNFDLEPTHHPINPPLPPRPRPPPTEPQYDSLRATSSFTARQSQNAYAALTSPSLIASNDSTTNAIDAINALSDLQNRWSLPPAGKHKDVLTKVQKRKKKRKRGNKNDGSTSDNPVVFRDAEEWIDVVEDTSAREQNEVSQTSNDRLSGKSEIHFPPLIKPDDNRLAVLCQVSSSEPTTYAAVLRGTLDQKDLVTQAPKNEVIELLDDDDDIEGEIKISDEDQDQKRKGMETKTQKRKKRRKRGNKNAGSTSDNSVGFRDAEEWDTSTKEQDEASQTSNDLSSGKSEIDVPPSNKPDDNCLAVLCQVSSSVPTTYASVIRGVLDQKDRVTQAPKNEVIELLDDDDDVEGEMEISDEDQDREIPKPGGQENKAISSDSKMPINASPTSMDAATQSNQGQDGSDKEKRALKLAELRAKAKLARTKLRIAEQKKAKGDAARELLSSSNSKVNAPLPTPRRCTSPPPKIAALRNIGSLVIKDVSRTGSTDEVRYRLQDYDENDQVQDSTIHSSERNSKSLMRKLQLARLQIEIKKKELVKRELVKKIKSFSASSVNTASKQLPEQSENEGPTKQRASDIQSKERILEEGRKSALIANQLKYDTNVADGEKDSMQNISAGSRAELDKLRRRQKELKQGNDIANLRNMIHRQQGLLKQVGRELTESSTQLQSCVDGIKSKQELLVNSEKKLNEMNHRKRIIEGMVLRATEQLIAARKALSERRLLNV
jgi:hypothetical protein